MRDNQRNQKRADPKMKELLEEYKEVDKEERYFDSDYD